MNCKNKEIAAIILHYKTDEETIRCIKSLYQQVDKIIIVDNSGDSSNLVNSIDSIFFNILNVDISLIEIVTPKTNLGFGRGMQYGIDLILKIQKYRAILLINNDAVASHNMIECMLPQLKKYNELALITPKMTEKSTPSLLWYHRIFALVLQQPNFGAFPYLSGACLLIPVSLLTTIKPFFDPDFFMYGEDVELSWRLKQIGIPLVIADANCSHTGSVSSHEGSLFYEYHVTKGHLLLTKKLARNYLDMGMLLIGRLISLPLRATLRCIKYKNLVAWHALVLILLGKSPIQPNL